MSGLRQNYASGGESNNNLLMSRQLRGPQLASPNGLNKAPSLKIGGSDIKVNLKGRNSGASAREEFKKQ